VKAKTLASEIQEAQNTLHAEVLAALRRFTAKTGLIVTGMDWESESCKTVSGQVVAVEYYNERSSLRTGA